MNSELQRLADFNTPGTNETGNHHNGNNGARPRRERQPPAKFATAELNNFVLQFNASCSLLPEWNEEHQHFEPTNDANPFESGFNLTKAHPSYREFEGDYGIGYYCLPSAYLGYKPGTAPKLYCCQVDAPPELLFNSAKKSKSDPDTLTWDQAMAESPENVQNWLKAADLEIKALEEKHTFAKWSRDGSRLLLAHQEGELRCRTRPTSLFIRLSRTRLKAETILGSLESCSNPAWKLLFMNTGIRKDPILTMDLVSSSRQYYRKSIQKVMSPRRRVVSRT